MSDKGHDQRVWGRKLGTHIAVPGIRNKAINVRRLEFQCLSVRNDTRKRKESLERNSAVTCRMLQTTSIPIVNEKDRSPFPEHCPRKNTRASNEIVVLSSLPISCCWPPYYEDGNHAIQWLSIVSLYQKCSRENHSCSFQVSRLVDRQQMELISVTEHLHFIIMSRIPILRAVDGRKFGNSVYKIHPGRFYKLKVSWLGTISFM